MTSYQKKIGIGACFVTLRSERLEKAVLELEFVCPLHYFSSIESSRNEAETEEHPNFRDGTYSTHVTTPGILDAVCLLRCGKGPNTSRSAMRSS
jgi:hypothetical protein